MPLANHPLSTVISGEGHIARRTPTMRPAVQKLQKIVASTIIQVRKPFFWDLLFLATISLIVLTWFRGNYFLKFDDSFFVLDPGQEVSHLTYLWERALGVGFPRALEPNSIALGPVWYVASFLAWLGASAPTWQGVFYYFFFFIAGLSGYALAFWTMSFFQVPFRRLASLMSGLFYMTNPYSTTVVWGRQTQLTMAYPVFPLLLGLFIVGVNSHKPVRFALLISLLTALFAPAVATLFALILFLSFAIYVVMNAFFRQLARRTSLFDGAKFLFLLTLFFLIVNSWWVIPASTLSQQPLAASASVEAPRQTLEFVSTFSTLPNDIRLLGWYFLYANWLPEPAYVWSTYYLSGVFTLLTYVPVFLAFGWLLVRRERINWFYLSLTCVGLFLMKGTAWPLGAVNESLLSSPLWPLFRIPYDKFGILVAVSYSVTIGCTTAELARRLQMIGGRPFRRPPSKLNRIFRRLSLAPVGILCLILFGMLAWPVWSGDVIPSGQVIPSGRIQVPNYYYAATKWLNQQDGDFRVLQVPTALGGVNAYNWSSIYGTGDPVVQDFLDNHPLVSQEWGYSYNDAYQQSLDSMLIRSNQTRAFARLLALGNVQYVMLHLDWDSRFIGYVPTPHEFAKFLQSQQAIALQIEFDQLWIYKNQLTLPLIYHPNRIIYLPFRYDSGFFLHVLENDSNWVPGIYIFSQANGTVTTFNNGTYRANVVPVRRNETLWLQVDSNPWQNFTISPENSFLANLLLTRGQHSIRYLGVSDTAPYLVSQEENATGVGIQYKRLNPTQYEIHLSRGGFLVFSESFAEDWTLTSRDSTFTSQHFVANGFANGWFVEGGQNLTLNYAPQRIYDAAKLVSGAADSAILFFLIMSVTIEKRNARRSSTPNNRSRP